ncbi:MAG: UdgX family uracil-DNA binding protein [Actinomycetia bacterium]|nr:UdgX family uracil-DNA binding protein [Actinomycetes bacterium]
MPGGQAELFPPAERPPVIDGATAPVPGSEGLDLETLRARAAECRACDLYERATQVVFGEGPEDAELVLIGEQPGDKEDLAGHPFVGPAGDVLDRALEEAGIDRSVTYVTNAVKHFKWKPAGKVRLHQKPNAREVAACRPWWEAEIAAIRPSVVCCLGATAAQAVFGSDYRVTRERGTFRELPDGTWATATIHPSAVLRSNDREEAFAGLVADLRLVAERLSGPR